MLITSTQANIVTKLAVTMFGAAPGGFKGYLDNLAASQAYNMENIAIALSAEPGFVAMYSGTTEQKVAILMNNLAINTLSADVQAVAQAYLTEQVDAGVNLGKIYADAIAYMATDANFATAEATINAKVAVANSFTAGFGANVTNLDILQAQIANVTANTDTSNLVTAHLTMGADILFGTAANDIFMANLSANRDTLQSGDYINGGAGIDTVIATIANTPFAILPIFESIEILQVRSQSNEGSHNGDNETNGVGNINGVRNTIDAELMNGTEQFWSVDSRATLVIEDVRNNSHETTIGFRNTDAGDVDYAVFFNTQHITAPGNVQSNSLFLELLDLNGMRDAGEPLLNNPYNGIRIQLGDAAPVLIAAPAAFTTTYQDMVDGLNVALQQLGLTTVTASLGNAFTAVNSVNSQPYQGTTVVLTNSGPEAVTLLNWMTPDGFLPPNTNIHTLNSTGGTDLPALTQTGIILDNVGKGSMSGDMLVGNMSTGENSGSQGIQQFNVQVDRDSWIKSLATTNNGLEVVNVQNTGSNGNLRIDSNGTEEYYGLTDVRVFDANQMTGDVFISAVLSQDVTDKYMNLRDTQANPAGDNSDPVAYRDVATTEFLYQGGSGNDTIILDISASNLAAAGTTTREDFVLTVNGGAGNDTIHTRIVDEGTENLASSNGVWYTNHQINSNITINGGSGNNTIWTEGAGDFTIVSGAGNDVIYSDNSGAKATFVFNTADQTPPPPASDPVPEPDPDTAPEPAHAPERNIDNLESAAALPQFLASKVQLTVDFRGYQSTVDLPLVNLRATDLSVNQAIKNAINNNSVLQNLFKANDGPGRTLVVESLIDGVIATAELNVTLTLPGTVGAKFTASEVAAINAALGTNYGGSAAVETAVNNGLATINDRFDTQFANNGTVDMFGEIGTNSESNNTINAGAGQDVIVLATEASSNESIVMGASFGHNIIVNFDAEEFNEEGGDRLDFAGTWGAIDDSNLAKGTAVDAQVNAGEAIIVNFAALGGLAASATFANLNTLTLAQLNENFDFGIANGAATASESFLIMVHDNDAVTGEESSSYKVFTVTSNKASLDATAVAFNGQVTLVGVDAAALAGDDSNIA